MGTPSFTNVAVLGLGVMGGSLARGLSTLACGPRVTGWSPEEEEGRAAEAAGAIEKRAAGVGQAVDGADLVVLAAPLGGTISLLSEIARYLGPDTAVIDVASLKVPVRTAARAAGLQRAWVGCHPMCGSEASGFAASRSDLYHGARVWLVADEAAEQRVGAVEGLWSSLGARPRRIEAGEHDTLMALVSHLPQLTATALARVFQGAGVDPETLGPGGRDMTRLAGSSVEMWQDLLAHAPAELPSALEALAAHLHTLAESLSAGDLDPVVGYMRETRQWSADA